MFLDYLERGVKTGVVAGLVFGCFLALVANPLVAFADELGHGAGDAVDQHDEHEAGDHHDGGGEWHESDVSTAVTIGVSVVAGVLWGMLLGGVGFGVAFYFLEPAIPGTGGTKSYLMAAAGLLTVSGAPWLALPPRPPGVEATLPVETRLVVYAGMMILGALVCLLVGFLHERFSDARGRATAAVVAALPLCLLAVPAALSPAGATGGSLPSTLATGLTGTVVFGQALLWLVLAGTHAQLRRRSAGSAASAPDVTPTDGQFAGDR